MSLHRTPMYQLPALIAALKAHGLEHDKPSQLADAFRIGWMAAQAVESAETAALRHEVRCAVLTGTDEFRRHYNAALLKTIGVKSFQDLCPKE